MKFFKYLIAVLIPISAISQKSRTRIIAPTYNKDITVDTFTLKASDTIGSKELGRIVMRAQDSTIYTFNGVKWEPIGTGTGGGSDQDLSAYAFKAIPLVATTTTNYTLVLSDASSIVSRKLAVDNTVTVPTNASVPFPVGTTVGISMDSTGYTSVIGAAGVTIIAPDGIAKLRTKGSLATVIKKGTNIWQLVGDLFSNTASVGGPIDGRSLGLVGDGITDNYAAFHRIFTDNTLPSHIYIPQGTFYTSKTDSITRFLHLEGQEGYEIGDPKTIIKYPKGISGPVLNNPTSAGSIIEGLTITSTLNRGANVVEYNPDNHTLLYLPVLSVPQVNDTYDFFDPYASKAVLGSAKLTAISTGLFKFVLFTNPSGTFAIGNTITGASSGATAQVKFVSKIHNLVAVGIINGSFTSGETISNASGVTAKFLQENFTNGTQNVYVGTLSNETGTIGGLNLQSRRITAFREQGSFAVGITLNRRAQLKNITVSSFGGDGIEVSSETPAGTTNTNLARIYNARVIANGGTGIRVEGGDANMVTIEGSTITSNRGWAIVDNSFLGISVNDTHEDYNMAGGYNSGSYINRHTTYTNPYSEGGYLLSPYESQENYIGGGSQIIGGTQGLSNTAERDGGYNGAELTDKNLKNNNIYTVNGGTEGARTVFRQISGANAAYVIGLEQTGLQGSTFGAGIHAKGPVIRDLVGQENGLSKTSSQDYGNMLWTIGNDGKFAHRIGLTRNYTPAVTVSGGGSGAVLIADVTNGSISKVTVNATGDNYPTNTTTITIEAPPSGTTAVLKPIIQDGHIRSVQIVSAGSGYLNTDIVQSLETTPFSYRPATDTGASLGDVNHRFSDLWVKNIHTGDGGVSATTSLKLAINEGNNYINVAPIDGNTDNLTFGISKGAQGLNIVTRNADGWGAGLNLYTGGSTSGLSISSETSNQSSLNTGGYRYDPGGSMYNFRTQGSTMSSLVNKNGKFYFLGKTGLTPNTNVVLDTYATVDNTGMTVNGPVTASDATASTHLVTKAQLDATVAGLKKVLSDANYTITSSDNTLLLPEPTSSRTITLPSASSMANKEIWIVCRTATTGRWILSGAFVSRGTQLPSVENFTNSGLVNGLTYHLVSADNGSGYKWYDIND